jgi:hypothetical protein
MPALTADIAAGTRAAQIETWTDAAIHTRYPRARDGSEEPAEGFYDSASNAATALGGRAALIGVERRRFSVSANDLLWPTPGAGIPTSTLIDPEQKINGAAMACRIELDLEAESTSMRCWSDGERMGHASACDVGDQRRIDGGGL